MASLRSWRSRAISSRSWLLCCLLLAVGACERNGVTVTTTPNGSRLELPGGVPPIDFQPGVVEVHGNDQIVRLRVEMAETEAQRERGLMYRTSMPEDAGMLFVYPQEVEGGFWMYNTHLPLSVAYVDGEGTIFQITRMMPCPSEFASLCPSYPAQRPFQYALEVNQDVFARHGIGPGARVTFQRQ